MQILTTTNRLRLARSLFLLSCLVLGFQDLSAQGQEKESADPFVFNTTIQGGLFHNFYGGLGQGTDYIGRVHFTISMDTEKAGLWNNGEFFFNGVNAHGGNPTAKYIGDFQPISRNEAAPERTGLFELWYKHRFKNGFILIGQHDMNTTMATSAYAGNSVNSAFGMSPSIFPNAGYAFSIFPRTMPAIYVKYNNIQLGDASIVLQGAVYAGFAEDFTQDRYNLEWNLDGSTHSRLEVHYVQKRGVVKIGAMYHSGDFPSILNEEVNVNGSLGFYLITDQLIVREDEFSEQGLGLFLQVGGAPGDQNLVPLFFSSGINYKGLINGRDKDNLFVGVVISSISNEAVETMNMNESRSIIEANYAFALGDHFVIQPDLQYLINPGANPLVKNSFSGFLRFSINY